MPKGSAPFVSRQWLEYTIQIGPLNGLEPLKRQPVGEAVADELLLVVAVAPVLFRRRSLPKSLVDNDVVQVAQTAQVLNRVGRIAPWHVDKLLGGNTKLGLVCRSDQTRKQPPRGTNVSQGHQD